jgi:putative tryptophan/tyrosine transport system substrate-binding protein
MRRRQFIALLGGAAATWPPTVHAQQADKLATIGYLGDDASSWSPWTARFVERLRELGWNEGQNIAIEYRWLEGHGERIAGIASEFVRRNVNVIVTYGAAVAGLKQATATIPIVFAIAVDPVGSGIVASLSHPGGNVTGLSLVQSDIAGKRLEFLREIVPGLRRLAIMFDGGYAAAMRENNETYAAARILGLDVVPHAIRRAEDIAPAFEAIKSQADALYVAVAALVNANREQIARSALGARLPTTFNESG